MKLYHRSRGQNFGLDVETDIKRFCLEIETKTETKTFVS